MIIKRVKLENIRSYINETIEFPEGSVLLSGDIGSGKSTILLAIEFALFGLKRGELAGDSLLRSGKNTGSVELCLDFDGKEIIIKRVLRRSKDSITQAAGYIIRDGAKKDLTAVELRSNILDILGYPKELLSKTKDLIYRYTVYTPQESMKNIVFAPKEERLETLRKVFGIDKYKRIRDNSIIIMRDIKERINFLQKSIADLEQKKAIVKENENEISILDKKRTVIIKNIENTKKSVESKKKELNLFDEKIKLLNNYSNEFNVENTKLSSKISETQKIIKDIDIYEKNISDFEKESNAISEQYSEKSPEEVSVIIKDYEKKAKEIESSLRAFRSAISESMTKKKIASETMNRILTLNHCTLCQQRVEHSHKENIKLKQENEIKNAGLIIKGIEKKEKDANHELSSIKSIINDLRIRERNLAVFVNKKANIESQKSLLKGKRESIDALKAEIGSINLKKKDLSSKLAELKGIEDEFRKAKDDFEAINNALKQEEIANASLEKEIEGKRKIIGMANKEIAEKLKQKVSLKENKELLEWIDSYFINVMEVIEKHVMFSIHSEFNRHFQDWFSNLIEDEIISARLDDQFSPVIIQNGYEASIDNLSGGEKTSIALSYRLSLNKIINSMIGSIRTKDLLILDEPTDGFSSDQLDKVKDILDQLTNRQIIIVSHESKIESFVQSIIRIRKEEHVSKVIT